MPYADNAEMAQLCFNGMGEWGEAKAKKADAFFPKLFSGILGYIICNLLSSRVPWRIKIITVEEISTQINIRK